MIKLSDLLTEYMASLRTELPKVSGFTREPCWSVVANFKVTVATGKSVPTNAYYGSSQIYGDPGEVVTANKGDALISLAGGDFLVSDRRKKAWKIIKLGPERTMAGTIAGEAPRTKIPKQSVNYLGDADDIGFKYDQWKSWIQGKK